MIDGHLGRWLASSEHLGRSCHAHPAKWQVCSRHVRPRTWLASTPPPPTIYRLELTFAVPSELGSPSAQQVALALAPFGLPELVVPPIMIAVRLVAPWRRLAVHHPSLACLAVQAAHRSVTQVRPDLHQKLLVC